MTAHVRRGEPRRGEPRRGERTKVQDERTKLQDERTCPCIGARWSLVFLLLLTCVPAFGGRAARAVPTVPSASAAPPLVVEMLLHDTLQGVSEQALRASLDTATKLHPTLIVLNLSTPGGLPASARAMQSVIERSPIPIAVYVREPGTHVSGQGLLLLEAGDVRAIHPASVLQPIIVGSSLHRDKDSNNDALSTALAAQAAQHGRSIAGLGTLVRDETVTADEAKQDGAADLVADTEENLLSQVDGMTIHRANGTAVVLHVKNALVVQVPMTAREHMMRALMNPDLTVLLLALGGLLIYLEVNTPGGVVPGAAGVMLVLLAAYALLHMPLRWEALVLLVLAGLLLLAEAHFQRSMAFAVVAMVLLVVGLRLLVDGPIPELEVNWGTAIGAGVGFGGVTAGLLMLGLRARRAKVRTGAEAMLGWLAVTQTSLAPEGEVLVRGELWRARLSGTDAYLAAGESVKVERALGTVLEVSPLPGLQGS